MSYLLSITPVFCHHLSQCLQNLDTQSLLIFLQQLLGMFDQPAQPHYFVSLITRSTVVYYMPYFNWYLYCLLAYKPAALALLAWVCVFGEEQLRPMQDIHQDWQLSLDQRPQPVLKSWHNVLQPRDRNVVESSINEETRMYEVQIKTHLQPLYDVPVVPRGGHHRLFADSVASRKSPAHGCLLDDGVGFYKQVGHLVVQVHRDGYCSSFGCQVHRQAEKEKLAQGMIT